MQDMFVFSNENDEFIEQTTFNSNFNCSCHENIMNIDKRTREVQRLRYSDISENDFDFNQETQSNNGYEIVPDFDDFTTHDFHKLMANIKQKNKTFSLFHTNFCSLNANFDEMQRLLESLSHKCSVIVLSETWNSEKTRNTFCAENLSGYQQYVGTRGTTIKGGCGFYVSDDIKFTARKDLHISYCDANDEFQGKWIEIITKKKNAVIGVYYRHPRKTSTHKFIDSINITLETIKKENKLFLICGDFNYNLLRFQQADTINHFLNSMLEKCLQPCIWNQLDM